MAIDEFNTTKWHNNGIKLKPTNERFSVGCDTGSIDYEDTTIWFCGDDGNITIVSKKLLKEGIAHEWLLNIT